MRLRLRMRVGNRTVEEVSLLNSGFEAPTPQLLIPVNMARALSYGHWPRALGRLGLIRLAAH